ncbi:MAG TPA: hypothetical protein VF941_23125 [Clostridia bacterium]
MSLRRTNSSPTLLSGEKGAEQGFEENFREILVPLYRERGDRGEFYKLELKYF